MTISKYEAKLEKAKAKLAENKGGSAFDYQLAKAAVNYYQSAISAHKRASAERLRGRK